MKPSLTILLMSRSIPEKHCWFWSRISIVKIHDIYNALSVSSNRVLSMLEDPKCLNENEERIFGYLMLLNRNNNVKELATCFYEICFVHFCLSRKRIQTMFNNLDGLVRLPISHCCDCILELPVLYSTYLEFANDFHSLLANTHDEQSLKKQIGRPFLKSWDIAMDYQWLPHWKCTVNLA